MIRKTEADVMSTWKSIDVGPLVTIRSITYNHAKYIEKALDSFLNQITSFRFEIIIHDDASTDGTTDIIREYAQKYPNIIIPIIQTENQYSKHNGGIVKAINQNIHGKYVALCEGDDYWTDSLKLEKQVKYMETHPECSMTIHAVDYVQNGRVVKVDRISQMECNIDPNEIIEGGGMYCETPSICCKTELFLNYPKWRAIATVGDYPLQILAAINGTVHYFPEVMGAYRYMTSDGWSQRQKMIAIGNDRRKNEIEWLSLLDEESRGAYHQAIVNRIAFYAPVLFKSGGIDGKQAFQYISRMSLNPQKIIFYLSIFKNYFRNKKMRKSLEL